MKQRTQELLAQHCAGRDYRNRRIQSQHVYEFEEYDSPVNQMFNEHQYENSRRRQENE